MKRDFNEWLGLFRKPDRNQTFLFVKKSSGYSKERQADYH